MTFSSLTGSGFTLNAAALYDVAASAALEMRNPNFVSDLRGDLALVSIVFAAASLEAFEGMYALAAYDARSGSLLLARDRFGEKPLYLHTDRDGLYFASEPKALFALLGHRLPVDLQQLSRFLVNGYKSLYTRPATFFEGLAELPAGTWLELDGTGTERRGRYWDPTYDAETDRSLEESATAVRDQLTRAVELRLRADVPLAFCMSGGIDSISLIAKRLLQYDVHAFTIVNDDPRYDERELVDCAVRQLGLRHTTVPLSGEDFLPRLRQLVLAHDAPVFTISYYVHWLLMAEIAAAGYRVSVSGTGADELFTGYYDHHLAYLREISGDREHFVRARADWLEYVRPLVRNPHLGDPDLFIRDPAFRGHIFLRREEFAGYLRHEFDEPFEERTYTDSLLRNRMLNELFHEVVPVILHEDDANAMSYSIENRSPYLDRGLFELALSLPTRQLVRNARTKAVLREAMRGIVPADVLDSRRKVGFNAPILDLLDTADPAVRAEVLGDSPVFEHVRRDKIEALLDKRELPNSESKFLFSFLGAKLFLEEYA